MTNEIQLLRDQINQLESAHSILQNQLIAYQNREKELEQSLLTRERAGLNINKEPDLIFEMDTSGSISQTYFTADGYAHLSLIKHISELINKEQAQKLLQKLLKGKFYNESHFSLGDEYKPYKNIQFIIYQQKSASTPLSFLISAYITISNGDKQEQINQFKELFLNFSDDYMANINHLTALLGSLLNASVTLYNRLDEGMLISWGQWNTPPDYQAKDKPEGHLCYDVIRGEKDSVLLVKDLQNTKYAQSDPNVIPYQLQTYIGYPVSNSDKRQVGSICAVFQSDFTPKDNDIKLLQIIAQAISTEEKRMLKEKELKQRGDLLAAVNKISEELLKNTKRINFEKVCNIIGKASKFDSVRVFQNFSTSLQNLNIEEIAIWGKGSRGKIVFNNICKIQNAIKWKNVFLKGEPIAVTNSNFPDKVSEIFANAGVHSFLLNPIILEGKIQYFILIINSKYEHTWSNVEKEFSKSISQKISDHLLTKKLRTAIEEDNRRFTTVMNSLNSSVYVSDMKTHELLYYNKYVEEQIKEVHGKYCYDLVLGEENPCAVCKNGLLLDENNKIKAPSIWRYYNEREKKWYLNENQAIKWQNGQIACLAIGTDITQLVHQEEELKLQKEEITERRNFYRRLLDNSTDLVWAKNKQGKFLFANKALADNLLIADIKEIKGKTSEYFANRQKNIDPSNKDYHTFGDLNVNSDKLVINNPNKNHYYDEYGNVQGKYLYLDIHKSPLYDNNNKLIGIVGSGRIVTKEKKVENELQESEQKFRGFFEKNTAILLQIDAKTRKIIDANKAALSFYGYSKSELLSKHIYDLNTLNNEEIDRYVNDVLLSNSSTFIFKHRLANGEIRNVQVFASPIILEDRTCIFSIVSDITQELKTKNELTKSEQKYRLLVENSSDLIVRASIEGIILYVSPNVYRIAGYKVHEEIGQHISKYFYNKRELSHALKLIDKCKINNGNGDFNFRMISKHGNKPLSMETRFTPIIINNKPESVHLVLRNVTERDQALIAFKESEAKYKYLVENTMDVIAQISTTGKILYVSPNTYHFGGYHAEEEVGNHISKYFYNKIELTKSLNLLKEILLYKKTGVFEFFYKHKSGKKIPTEASFAPIIKNGKVNSIHLVLRNISFRKKAQLKIKESELKLKEAQKIAKLGHWEYNIDKELIYLSDEVFNIYEIDNTEEVWNVDTFFSYVHPSDKIMVRQAYIKSMKNRSEYNLDHRVILKGNKLKYVSQKAYHICNKEGRVTRTIGTIQDITNIKKTELALKANKDKLTKLNNKLLHKVHEEVEKSREKDRILLLQSRQASMGEMIENIAHQWRQPLNEISLLLGDLEDSYLYNELTKESFDKSITQTNSRISYLSQTIDDFRNYFIVKSESQEFDIALAIKRSISFVHNNFKRRGIQMTYNLQDGILLNGQVNLISQALLNILNNAKDVFKEREIKNPQINIVLASKGKDIIIEISDNAGGIDEKIIGKIFDPYFTTKDEKSGTGLGLYIANTIIHKQLGGVLFARNIKNGASFIIEFLKQK